MSRPGTATWLARREARLAWRDWLAMMTAGRRRRARTVAVVLVVLVALMHLVAHSMVGRFSGFGPDSGKATLVVVTGTLLLSWSLMVSQAMESVTRAFYARADLDLVLSSPTPAWRIFSVRTAAIAGSIVLMSLLLAAPFINVLAARGGTRWLAAYGVVAALGLAAAATALALTHALFRAIGARRTRLVAQMVAAVIGATFVIGLQIGAIMSYGTLSRIDFLESETILARAPDLTSVLYWPARAALGDGTALLGVSAASLILLVLAIAAFAPRFGEHALAAAGVTGRPPRAPRRTGFRPRSPRHALRRKEWRLLLRDPWLVSQTLMQILYLLPPAFLLWRSFDSHADALVVLVPVLVMAAGQLAGGLAWLAVSGEDAPDLIASAPVPLGDTMRAKVEAVMGAIALVFLPFVAAIAIVSAFHALVSLLGIVAAAAAAIQIQFWFRAQAKRSHFRRRQVSSRAATFAEAFSSITWAATATLAAAGSALAPFTGLLAIGILSTARLVSPHRAAPRHAARPSFAAT